MEDSKRSSKLESFESPESLLKSGMTTPDTSSKISFSTKVLLAFASVYTIWGSTYLAIRFVVETIPPFLSAGIRFLISGLMLYAFVRLKQKHRRPTAAHWKSAFIVGGLMLMLGNGVIVNAQRLVPSGLASLIVATVPLWMVLVQWIGFEGRRPNAGVFIGMAMGLTGVWFLIAADFSHINADINIGAALSILAASFSWSIGSVYSRRAPLPSNPLLAIGMQMLGGGTLLVIAGLLHGEAAMVHPQNFSIKSVYALIYLILIGSLLGYTAYIWLLKNVGVARTSTYAFVNPVVAVFLGWAFAGETLTQQTAIAAFFIIMAVIMIVLFNPENS